MKEKVSDSGSNGDVIVGLKGKTDLNEKGYQTDMGTGDSDLTWQALAAVSYRFQKNRCRVRLPLSGLRVRRQGRHR